MAAAVGLEPALASRASGGKQRAEAQKAEGKDGTEETLWRPVLNLPCQLTVDLPLPRFHIADLLGLRAGSVIGTNWQLARDVPLHVNGTLIGWSEFEVVGDRLAVRLTELA